MRTTSSIFLFAALARALALAQVAQGFSNSHADASRRISSATFATPAVVIDEVEAFSKSTFPIAPDNLIARAKEVLGPEIGIGTKDGGACLAEDFQFCAAVVGPIPKEEYLNALGTFKLEDSFEIQQNLFGFTVDPMQPNRVWYFDRQTAKHVDTFNGVEATGKELEMPPQVFHIDFNKDGKIKENVQNGNRLLFPVKE